MKSRKRNPFVYCIEDQNFLQIQTTINILKLKTCPESSFNLCHKSNLCIKHVVMKGLWKGQKSAFVALWLWLNWRFWNVVRFIPIHLRKLPILFDSTVDGSVTFWISIGYKKLQIFSRGKRRERKEKLLRCLSES